MHKLAQPVKLWYLSSFFRAEAPQRGPLPPVLAGRGRGDRLRRARDRRRADRAARRAARGARRQGRRGCASRASARPRPAPSTARSSGATCAPTRTQLSAEVREPHRPQPAARVRRRATARTREVMRDAPKLLDRLAPDDAEHFAAVRALLDDAGLAYELDPTLVRGLDYYTRTVFEFTSDALGAQSGVGGGGRYDGLIEQLGGPPTPGLRLGGRGRADAAGRAASCRSPPSSVDLFVALAEPGGSARRRSSSPARRAAPGSQAQLELAGRSLKGQLKHADRIGARYVAIVGDERRGHAQGHGVRRAATTLALDERDPDDPAREPAVVKHAPRPNDYRDAWCGELTADARRHAGARRRLGAPPPRPRRADLHRPARPLGDRPARVPPRDRARGARARRTRCAPRT